MSKRARADAVLSVLFCAGLACMLVLIMGTYTYNQIAKRTGLVQFNCYNALAAFPFKHTENHAPARKSFSAEVKNTILAAEAKITQYAQQQFFCSRPIAAISKRFGKLLGLDMTSSSGVETPIISVGEDWLGTPYKKEDVSENVQKTLAFAAQMEAEGRNFVVFENPHKHATHLCYADYYEENRKAVNDALLANDVRVIDIDDYMQQHAIDPKSIFFKTDHHWNPRAGLWANALLCEYLNEHFGYSISTEIFDIAHYTVQTLERSFLGSYGTTVTTLYAEKEDFELLLPKYETDLSVFRSCIGKTVRGTIPETLYDFKMLHWQNTVNYGFYTGSESLIAVHNNNLHDGSSLLFIHFSFGDVQIPTLSQVAEDFYAIDLRAFNGSLQTFIKEKNPQTVVLAYPTTCFSAGETQNDSGKQYFDFD